MDYEKNPHDYQNAVNFFRELNKHEMHQTVLRLYFKDDLANVFKANDKNYQAVKEQFDYAKDHIK